MYTHKSQLTGAEPKINEHPALNPKHLPSIPKQTKTKTKNKSLRKFVIFVSPNSLLYLLEGPRTQASCVGRWRG